MVVGGWAWVWWFVTDVQKLKLEVMTLNPKCESIETSQGVPLTVTTVAQCKITTERDYLAVAAEQFLGKDSAHIRGVILTTLEGHLRAVLGTLTVEEVYSNRDQFASLVREVASPDVSRMGIEVLSFTIKDVYDEVDYLASLGKARTAAVKRDAAVGVAQAERDAGIREAECEKSAMDIKYTSETLIEAARKDLNLQIAMFEASINALKEEAKLAYELEAAKMLQKIRTEEMGMDVTEREQLTFIQEQEVMRKKEELESLVRLPAAAEAYRITKVAEGLKIQSETEAKEKTVGTKLVAKAEADAIDAVGAAEAERMRSRAAAYKSYSDAAILSMTLEALPKVAAEISAPLSKTDEIVILGGTPSPLTNLIAQTPPVVAAMTGTDIGKVSLFIRILFVSIN
jgi:flotillin